MAFAQEKETSGCSMFKTSIPHFFKIILQDTLRDNKLGIPKKFVRMYGNELSSFVTLKVPTGAQWKVELIKGDGGIWLNKGWREFAEYYDIILGSFLVFEYLKNSSFRVFVFDMSATEIDYPVNVKSGHLEVDAQGLKINVQSDAEDVVLVENLGGESSSRKKRKEKSQVQIFSPQKQMRTCSGGSDSKGHTSVLQYKRQSDGIKSEISSENVDSHRPWQQNEVRRHDMRMTTMNQRSSGGKGSILPTTANEKTPVFQRAAAASVSRKPVSPPTHLRPNKIPGNNGVCIKKESSNGQTLTGVRKKDALKRAAAYKSTNPFCIVAIQPSHIGRLQAMRIPFSFAKRHFKQQYGKVVLNDSSGGAWTVNYRLNMVWHKCDLLASCWMAFAREKKLKVGDVCVFELIEGTKLAAKVVIFRAIKVQ